MSGGKIAQALCLSATVASAAVTLVIFGFMALLGYPAITNGGLVAMLTGPWAPLQGAYGIHAMIIGTLAVSSLGMIIALPLCLGCAAFIQTVAPRRLGGICYRAIEIMTGMPTVIYGFVGIFLLVPLVREAFGHGSGLCILSAGAMLALVISPTMILFFVQGMARVPRSYLLAVSALGGTPVQRLLYVMLPQAWRSILAGVILAFGRAIGDTMIALMLAGNAVAAPHSILDSTRTLTAHIGLVIAADFDSPEFRSLFVCGLILYGLTAMAVLTVRFMAGYKRPIP